MSLLDAASLLITPNGTKAGTLYSVIPNTTLGDMDVVRATDASYRGSNGLIQYALPNVPRLDYSNGTCPSILVEPQRTNLFTYSEQFDNVSWIKSFTTLTPNYAVAPDNSNTAQRAVGSVTWTVAESVSLSIGGVYTLSFYVKSNTSLNQNFRLFACDGSSLSSNFSANGTFQKFSFTFTATSGTLHGIARDSSNTSVDLQIWGAQLEVGSYASSYIPTTSASVTRNADVISKTGISSLIGQTEGTLFLDLDFNNVNQSAGVDTLMVISDGTAFNYISIFLDTPAGAPKTLLGIVKDGGAFSGVIYGTSPITATRYKIALAYKNNDIALYANGTLIGTDTLTNIPTTSAINFNSSPINDFVNVQQEYINTSALWKTRLTNTQLAQLTTI